MHVPSEIPVTNPVSLIVATAVLDEVHGLVVAAELLPINWVVLPTQVVKFPDIVGRGFICTTI